ncbi:MAG: 5'-nucleotidase C-terminal domain-containing protein, partial [Fimbriimonadales bacterium]|nr:5'-nucleotidase C-terminal domain-containing protein [Fimbriimonadales bacterium]
MTRVLTVFLLLGAVLVSRLVGQIGLSDDPGAGPHALAQAAGDVLREEAGADLAFLPAGMLNKDATGDLATLLKYPTDELVVLRLTGKEVLSALERSVSYYPEPNSAFLQISGGVVTFSASAQPGSRILSVDIGGAPLEPNSRYNVAM